MSKEMGQHVSHRGAERDHIESNKGGSSGNTPVRRYVGRTGRGEAYYLAALLTLQIMSVIVCILVFAWGITRCFDFRFYTQLQRYEPSYWVITVLLIAIPVPMVFMTLFYVWQLQRWTAFFSLTFFWRGVFFFILGCLLVTREFYDIIVGVIVFFFGILYILIEFLPFVPKPSTGLIPLRKSYYQ